MNRITGASPPPAPLPLNGRQQIDRRQDVDPQIRAAAEGMEAMFVNQMMQAMRKTVDKSEMSLDSPATEIYQGMLDTEMAQKTARLNSVGLADQIIAYLEARSYNNGQAASNEGRGTIRSQPVHGEASSVQEVPAHAREQSHEP